ncbi:MAG: alpha/beta hydrolase [Candidatus Pacebacteria bacterium]|nr:alpha/beta hydrolase [Candidatus Paceibacterota bacterium]
MTTVHIIHGCPSDEERAMNPATRTYDKHWMPWLKEQLTACGVKVNAPLMPNPWAPDYAAFKAEFEKTLVSEDDVLIGHSCGGAFLVRWLGDSKQKVRKLILVAPWKIPDAGDKKREEYYGYEIDRTIPERVGEIVTFTSDDEEEDGKKSVKIFHEALGGRVIELSHHGHFTFGDMGTEEFPELLAEILK